MLLLIGFSPVFSILVPSCHVVRKPRVYGEPIYKCSNWQIKLVSQETVRIHSQTQPEQAQNHPSSFLQGTLIISLEKRVIPAQSCSNQICERNKCYPCLKSLKQAITEASNHWNLKWFILQHEIARSNLLINCWRLYKWWHFVSLY